MSLGHRLRRRRTTGRRVVAVNVRVVWQQAKDDAGWVCGAMITDEGLAAWREVVDRTAEA